MSADYVREPYITPAGDTFYVGDVITCHASGNPAPSYHWEQVNPADGGTVEGADLLLTEDMLGENEWRCEAANEVENQVHTVTTKIMFNVCKSTFYTINEIYVWTILKKRLAVI